MRDFVVVVVYLFVSLLGLVNRTGSNFSGRVSEIVMLIKNSISEVLFYFRVI